MPSQEDTSYYADAYRMVDQQIRLMENRADSAISNANALITALSVPFSGTTEPTPPNVTMPGPASIELPTATPPTGTSFGTVPDIVIPAHNFSDDPLAGISLDDLGIPDFNPSIASISIPAAPAPIDTTGLPDRPDLGTIDLPDAPVFNMPQLDDLEQITIPVFQFPDLPTFDAQAPEFTGSAPSTVLQWAEPQYASVVLDEVKARIVAMLSGGTGMPPEVEQALFDRARTREDQTALKAVQDAFDTWAARGFSMPPGMLVEQVNTAQEANQLQVNALSREILAKSAEWEIENLRQAVQQGIALEGVLINSFMNVAQRAFESARYRVEADLALYNAQVTVFNARQSAYQTAAQVFDTRLRGALAKLDVYRAEIDGQRAIGELNQQKVAVYQARLGAVQNLVDVYKARMQGAQIQSDVIRNGLEVYKADIQAYAERLNAEKVRFDAYEAQVKAEGTKASVIESEARAFAATVSAVESKANIKIRQMDAKVQALRARIEAFTAELSGERAKVETAASVIQSRVQAYSADVSRYSAELNSKTAVTELHARLDEARLRNNLAYYEIQLKAYDAAMTRLVENTRLKSEGIKAAGQMASQLAAGAMAAVNVHAGLSGSASANMSTSDSYNVNVQRDE